MFKANNKDTRTMNPFHGTAQNITTGAEIPGNITN